MKKILPFLAILTFLGCKEDLVKQPKHLIERSQMVNIMYDLSLLEAIKYQNPAVLDSNQIRPKQFIYKKYKIDSLQLAQNNVYYASDYKNYKIMFDEVVQRLERDKKKAKALIKSEEKKNKLRLAKLKKKKQQAVKVNDSLQTIRKKIN
ncbi:DUF4296 domain-containing protein [Flavobacterium sp.]|jgi:hypothetical protein|uniref:DUF4296 domain-containing protein n=1 Tax=Flavobacterium sp. TaxID=239 RepID=UPI0025F93C52|nr:DUF4296 domain-containing protein [Flavobacterium sp.]